MDMYSSLSPISLSASIIANLATDILKHFGHNIDDTLTGKILKRVGLIAPNFQDRLLDILKRSLECYFDEHPGYKLSGIVAFFRDATVARQIGEYILDRQPINQHEIELALHRHLGSEAITTILIQRRDLQVDQIVPDFMKCYHRTLNEQLDAPQVAILLEILEQRQALISEIRTSEERLRQYISALQSKDSSPQPAVTIASAPAHHVQPKVASNMKKKVFLSHRGADSDKATKLAEALKQAGHTVLFDQWDLHIGDSIIGWMNHALTVADCMVLCLSKHGDGPFMSREWQAFLHRQLSAGNVRILPIRLTGGDLPPVIADYLLADAVVDFDAAVKKVLDTLEI